MMAEFWTLKKVDMHVKKWFYLACVQGNSWAPCVADEATEALVNCGFVTWKWTAALNVTTATVERRGGSAVQHETESVCLRRARVAPVPAAETARRMDKPFQDTSETTRTCGFTVQ